MDGQRVESLPEIVQNSQKVENLLNLALSSTEEEREKSLNLNTGYDPQNQEWEIIVRFAQTSPLMRNLEQPREESEEEILPFDRITWLSNGYAILHVTEAVIRQLARRSDIIYIEKPKRLFFAVDYARTVSCISSVQTPEMNLIPNVGLLGQGTLVAVIDSGVDYFHPDFRNEDGTTRMIAIWDQTAGDSMQGVEYNSAQINEALRTGSRSAGYQIVPEQDFSGHGTEVLGIAAGNGRASGGRYRGVAPMSDLLIVKLGISQADGFPRTTELMRAIDYVVFKAQELGQPIAVNLSFGNVYGSHRGTSLLETYLDTMADQGRSSFVVGTGNEGNSGGHISGVLDRELPASLEFVISEFETTLNIQLWKNYADRFQIQIVPPNGRAVGPLGEEMGTARYQIGGTTLLLYYGEPAPYQVQQEIYLDFIPQQTYLDRGIWRIVLIPERIVNGSYSLWMNDAKGRNESTRFLRSTPDTTMTIPSTASRAIAVGAYDARLKSYASFSGRGWPDEAYNVRPDLAAPGVEITTTAVGGGYVSVTGTSFAAPFVTGAAALLMEWGMRGNDPYLYGEKVKAYLRRGARQLPGYTVWPNNQVGWGTLCLRNSLPV